MRGRRWSTRSARGSTACRWRSSWPPTGRGSSRSPRCCARLDDRLALLTGGPRDLPARQRSLRATLDWSWDVLDEPERTLLGRLTVFEGGASLEAAEAVCNPAGELGAGRPGAADLDPRQGLAGAVRGPASTGSRGFGMFDTIREFAAERADAGRRRAPARALLPRVLRARRRRGGARASTGPARAARARARQHPPGLRVAAAQRRGGRRAAGRGRVRPRAAVGRTHARGAWLACGGARGAAGRPANGAPGRRALLGRPPRALPGALRRGRGRGWRRRARPPRDVREPWIEAAALAFARAPCGAGRQAGRDQPVRSRARPRHGASASRG